MKWDNRLNPETLAIIGENLEGKMVYFATHICDHKEKIASDDVTCGDMGCEKLGPGGCTHPEHPVNKFREGGGL